MGKSVASISIAKSLQLIYHVYMTTTPRMTSLEDHDKITTYTEKFNNFKEATLALFSELESTEKMDQKAIDHLQHQIDKILNFFDEIQLAKVVKTVQADSLWIRDFKMFWKIIMFLYPLALFLIGLAISSHINPVFLFKNLGF